GANVLLGFPHGSQVFGPAEIGSHFQRPASLRFRPPLRPFRGHWLSEQATRLFDFAHRGVVFRAKAAAAFGEHIANDPQAVLPVIESDETVIKHQHRVVYSDFITEALGETL